MSDEPNSMKDFVRELAERAERIGYDVEHRNPADDTWFTGVYVKKSFRKIEYSLKINEKMLEIAVDSVVSYYAWTGTQWARQGGVIRYFTNEELVTQILSAGEEMINDT